MYHPISTKTHSYLDYVTTLMLPFLPNLLGARGPGKVVMRSVAGLIGGQTLITNFEGGKIPILPMQMHLANDALVGVGLLTASLVLRNESPIVRGALAGLGLFSLGAALLTEPVPRGKGRAQARRTAKSVRRHAGETIGEMAGA